MYKFLKLHCSLSWNPKSVFEYEHSSVLNVTNHNKLQQLPFIWENFRQNAQTSCLPECFWNGMEV